MEESYGIHLMLRVADVERPDALEDPGAVSGFLEGLVERVGMSILAGPLVGIEHGDADRYGVSGVVILKESHAAVHTYPGLSQAFLDLFSCRPFEPEVVQAVITEFFGRHRVIENMLFTRGAHWAGDVAAHLRSWANTR